MITEIRFVSGNRHKLAEATTILGSVGVTVLPFNQKIDELQTDDVEKLLKDKAIRAFDLVRRPLFVEHTGLRVQRLNGFPGGLTQLFWDTLQADRFCELLGGSSVIAETHICCVDGRRFYFFDGAVTGTVADRPRGPRDFQWDCVFVPNERAETFAEMGADAKNAISMRKAALDKLALHVGGKDAAFRTR